MRTLLVSLTLLSSGYLLATPYLTSQDLQQAFHSSDTQKIDDIIDFKSVKKSVSKQLSPTQNQDDGLLATIGKKLASGAIELVVNAVVTPEGLAQIMEGNTKGANKKNGAVRCIQRRLTAIMQRHKTSEMLLPFIRVAEWPSGVRRSVARSGWVQKQTSQK